MYVVKVIDRKRLAGAAGTGELTKVLLLLRSRVFVRIDLQFISLGSNHGTRFGSPPKTVQGTSERTEHSR
jgi:hypothetical protein